MTARLKRLEAMVRGMMDGGGEPSPEGTRQQPSETMDAVSPAPREETSAQVVVGRATTFVGATHFMAMLDDVSFSCCLVDGEGGA